MALEFDESDLNSLLNRCRRGDAAAWRDLVDRFQGFVYSIPKRMRLSDEDCADVFQSTFVALYRHLDRIESSSALPKWLGVTASREALRVKRLSSRMALVAEGETDRPLEDVLADEDMSAEQEALAACDSLVVRQAVQSLNERCAKLLHALYLGPERPYQDVSASLGIPIGAIGPTRARCLEKLRKKLMDAGFFN